MKKLILVLMVIVIVATMISMFSLSGCKAETAGATEE